MFGKLLKSVSWQVRAELRRSLKSNRDFKKLRWNPVERILLPAPPITSGLCWFSGPQPSRLLRGEYFRPVLLPFALQHFKGITTLSG
jgi:hypothetical protein